MQSIMGGEIAYTLRRSDLGIDRTTKRDDGFFRVPGFRSSVTLPMICFLYIRFPKEFSYHLKTQTSGTLLRSLLKETSLLKSAHTVSFALFNQQLIPSAISRLETHSV